jgi:hypothetical protein
MLSDINSIITSFMKFVSQHVTLHSNKPRTNKAQYERLDFRLCGRS